MLWVIAGTGDASRIISRLREEGFEVIASATTHQGGELARRAGAAEVIVGELDTEGMVHLIRKWCVRAVVDATHPFAIEASKNAIAAARQTGAEYIRYEREEFRVFESWVHEVEDFRSAAELASKLGKVVLYTAGVKNLPTFLKHCTAEVVVRVLPAPEVVARVIELGIPPERVVAMYPRKSIALNRAIIEAYGAEVLVTKESGREGGLPEKLAAAREAGVPVVVIRRPKVQYPKVCSSVEAVVQEIKKLSLT